MIDHISIGVRDLAASTRFYDAVLAPIGYVKMHEREKTVGWGKPGKPHAEFWINLRAGHEESPRRTAASIFACARATRNRSMNSMRRR